MLGILWAAPASERVALGPKAGWRITHVGDGGERLAPVRVPPSATTLLAEVDGYNVHAGVIVPTRARGIAGHRLTQAAVGRVFWELQRPYDDGTTHLAFEPLGSGATQSGAPRRARAPPQSDLWAPRATG